MQMKMSFAVRGLRRLAAGFSLALAMAVPLAAQSSGDEVTPAVEQLYAQAKTAEQQGDAATAIEKYRAMIRAAPHLAAAYNNLGMLYFNQRDYAQAAQVLERGLRVNPNMPTASTLLGLSYFELGDNQKAEPLLERAARANPSDGNVQLSLAHVLLSLDRNDEATRCLSQYLKTNPKDQQAWYLLGKTYLQLSEDALGKVNQIDPNSYVAHEVAGEIDESMHNYDGALVEFRKAVELAPQQPGTHLRLANVYWVLGKWESAEQEFRTELDHAPGDCVARWKLADSMREANAPDDDILKNLDEALKNCPQLMQARVDRARVLIHLKKENEALPDLLLALKANPDEPSIHFLLASVYRAQGQPDQSKKELHVYGELQRAASAAVAERANEAITLKSAAH
jgi:tetratricopeptide (TPR) repeat protein